MLNKISITLLVLLGLLATAFANTRVHHSQPNDAAAQKVERKFKQYKRVHQEILKMIVEGKQKQAIMALREIVSVVPRDGESHYMLAVAYATDGQLEAAVTSVGEALDLGIPATRFLGGTTLRRWYMGRCWVKAPALASLYGYGPQVRVR